jgi:hypothetical protein
VRLDAPLTDAVVERFLRAVSRNGGHVRFGTPYLDTAYALVEGRAGSEAMTAAASEVDGRWYDETIIALAIEPTSADALPFLNEALGGAGAPAGVRSCRRLAEALIVEIAPYVTRPALVLQIADVELRRFGGGRRTRLLTPLSLRTAAALAADALQAPEIAADRILEALLQEAHLGSSYVE